MSDTSPRLAIVVSQFNPEVTHGLRDGALKYLSRKGIPIAPDNIYSAPGAFEIPANFNGVNYKGSVTLLGTIVSQSMTLDLVPGTAPANSARHDVLTLNGAMPSW